MPVTLTRDLSIQLPRDPTALPADAVRVLSMPAGLFHDAHERQAEKNHRQSLAVLNGRGGVSAQECLAILACEPVYPFYLTVGHTHAHRLLYAIRVAFNRGRLVTLGGMEPA